MRQLVTVVVLALVAGCSLVNDPGRHQGGGGGADAGSGDGGTDGGGLAPIPADEICMELAKLGCQARESCCEMSGLPPVDDCVATVVDACETDLAPIFTDPRTRYSPMRAAEVIAEGYDLMNDCSTDIAQWYVFELLSVMRGDSGPRVNCAPPGGSFQDDPAAFWQCDADMDLVCRPNSSGGWECQGASAAGGACNIIYHCQRGLYCTSYILGSCQPQKDRGDECTDGTECRSLVCGDSGTCDELDRSVYCVPVEDFFGDQMGG